MIRAKGGTSTRATLHPPRSTRHDWRVLVCLKLIPKVLYKGIDIGIAIWYYSLTATIARKGTAMFHLNNIKQLEKVAADIGTGKHGFDENDVVWSGDDGSYVIGADFNDFDEDEQTMYQLAGVVGDYKRGE